MTVEPGTNEPNEHGFAGDPSGPEPAREPKSAEDAHGEEIAVPAGDLTGALTEALEPGRDDSRDD
jgi:hypothetical protein